MNDKVSKSDFVVAGRPYYEVYEERRQYPRIELGAPVELFLPGQEKAACLAYNVSPDGLQVRCNRQTAARINPGGRPIREDSAFEVGVSLVFPLKSGPRPCRARCRVLYFALVAADTVAFGMRFVKFRGDDRDAVLRFIQQSLEPILAGD